LDCHLEFLSLGVFIRIVTWVIIYSRRHLVLTSELPSVLLANFVVTWCCHLELSYMLSFVPSSVFSSVLVVTWCCQLEFVSVGVVKLWSVLSSGVVVTWCCQL
jgi:hypothetical protein